MRAGSPFMTNPPRTLPELTDRTRAFWTGGEHGKLMIARCQSCGNYIHPPQPICPKCFSRDVQPEAVSGLATLASFTVNHQQWMPDMEVPFVIAIVELEEQPSVRLTTNIVNCPIEDVRIGMKLKVTFEQQDDIFLPLFEPA